MSTADVFLAAQSTRDIRLFMQLVFPPEWRSVAARIIETGATMAIAMCAWAPRWSPVPPTCRSGATEMETAVKSCIFRAHDCIHQLWGLPIPGEHFSDEDFYIYKRAQMCGEIAVLALTEFLLCERIAAAHPSLRGLIEQRRALLMLEGPLRGCSPQQIAARLDGLLHKKLRPKWVREFGPATGFVDDYVPMLEDDRRAIDHNWKLMKTSGWRPVGAPNTRYNSMLDGLELTSWMVTDFLHLLGTDPVVDEPLASFNRERRRSITLPADWNQPS